jgi:hippurate hydrolase
MASADRVFIDIIGKGGHASMPHDAVDPVPVACEIVMAIQSFITRQVNVFDPAVVTIGKIEAGTTDNVIPETATLTGTIRTLSPERRAMVGRGLKDLAENIARAHGAKATVRVVEGFPVTRCDSRAVDLGRETIKGLYGPGEWIDMTTPVMGAEDFSYVLDKVPGAMFFLGASKIGSDWRASCACHSNRMVMDEAVMARGAAVHAALAERFLAEGFSGA